MFPRKKRMGDRSNAPSTAPAPRSERQYHPTTEPLGAAMMESAGALGAVVREARHRKGWTQIQLVEAGAKKFSLATLKNIEGGKANPRLDIITAVFDALGCELMAKRGAVTWRITGTCTWRITGT